MVDAVNRLQQSPDWASTAVIIAYDDSDGWYDHQASSITNGSSSSFDALNGGTESARAPARAPRRWRVSRASAVTARGFR